MPIQDLLLGRGGACARASEGTVRLPCHGAAVRAAAGPGGGGRARGRGHAGAGDVRGGAATAARGAGVPGQLRRRWGRPDAQHGRVRARRGQRREAAPARRGGALRAARGVAHGPLQPHLAHDALPRARRRHPRHAGERQPATLLHAARLQIIDDGFVSLTLSHCPLQCFIFTEIFTWKILLQENWECGTGHMFDEMSRKENQRKLGVWHSHQTLICGSSGTYDPSLMTFSSYTIQ